MADETPNPYADRADSLKAMKPQLVANVRLYATEDGGKNYPAYPGWGCPCMVSQEQPLSGYDGWPILEEPIQPGEERNGVGFVFLSPEGADVMRRAGRFHLWEGKFIGEAVVAS
jgi:hypothetical protein